MDPGGWNRSRRLRAAAVVVSAALALGCGPRAESIKVDGSSTVYPISEAVAEAFRDVRPDVRVTVGLSGTGGGMKKFTAGEIDICDASRGIKASETAALEAAGVGFTEFSVALDGIAVIVHPENDWVDTLTVDQLQSIWRPDEPVQKWSELDPDWPDEEIKLYGPGTDSGTFDYFTKVIVGEEKACRADFSPNEDDNVLVTGVSEDEYSLGYFGFAYYVENTDKLKVLSIVSDEDGEEGVVEVDAEGETKAGGVTPTVETIRSNEYKPLSRPLFIYVRDSALDRPEGAEFVRFYLDRAGELAGEVGYVAVSDEEAAENDKKYEAALAR